MVLLNGIPVHWRSNKQPKTADSPACAELYTLKEGVRDARLLFWVAEEMVVSASWPFVVNCVFKQAIIFQEDTCPKSRIRGSFDLREGWVAEVKTLTRFYELCPLSPLCEVSAFGVFAIP